MSPQRFLTTIVLAPGRWIERRHDEERVRLASAHCDMCDGYTPAGTRLCDECDTIERCAP